MSISVRVSNVVFEPGNGRVLVGFSDGTGFEFRSKAELQARITAIAPADFAKQVALAMWVQRGISDGTELVGRTVSMDLSKNAFGVIFVTTATRVFDWMGYPLPWPEVSSNYITLDLSASDVKYAMVFQAEDAVAITHCGFRYSLRTGTPPVYRISIQSVSASDGKPTGTILGGGSPASATFTPPASTAWDGTWQWVALSNSYTPAVGDLFAIVVEYSSGTINGSNFGRFTSRGLGADGTTFARPYGVIGGGGSWTVQARPYIMGYKTASRAYGHPHTSFIATSYSSNSTPDAYGLVFNLAAADTGWSSFVLKGIRWLGHLSDSSACGIVINVRDLSGGGAGTNVVTETLDTDQMGSTSTAWQDYIFAAPPTLNTGTKYAVMLGAGNTGMNMSLTKITTPGATEAAAFIGGSNYWSGTSTDTGTITEDTSSRPCMALLVEGITANAGGIKDQSHMTGGMI